MSRTKSDPTGRRPWIAPLGDESGVAVLSVLLAIMLLLILSGALLLTARVAMERAMAETDSTKALDVAEAGLQIVADSIVDSGFTEGQTGIITGTLPGGGEYSVAWTANASLPWFTLESSGYYPSSTAPTGKRRISAQVFALNPWDFQYAGGMTGASVNGNVWVQGPFYVNDELRMTGTAGIHGGPLIIYDTSGPGGGDLILDSNSADIGKAGSPVALFRDGTVVLQKNPNSYFVDPDYRWAPELQFPEVSAAELEYYRADNAASPWLTDPGTRPWEVPTATWDIDGDARTDMDSALTFIRTKTPPLPSDTSYYGSGVTWSWPGWSAGNWTSEVLITFDNSGGIEPVLFVDGDLTFDASQINIRYQGVGTIVASGRITVIGNLAPQGSTLTNNASTTTLNGFPATNALGLITRNNFYYGGSTQQWLAAAVYSGGTATFAFQGNFRGSVVTRLLDLGSQVPHLYIEPNFAVSLPPRMPGSDVRIKSIIGWRELSPP